MVINPVHGHETPPTIETIYQCTTKATRETVADTSEIDGYLDPLCERDCRSQSPVRCAETNHIRTYA